MQTRLTSSAGTASASPRSRRLKEIDQHVTAIGIALSQGRMPPRVALQLVDIEAVYLALFESLSPEQLSDVFAEPARPSPVAKSRRTVARGMA
jgi:hypothetical protein